MKVWKNVLYVLGNDQIIEIANGSTIYVKAGDECEKDKAVGEFEPYSEPIIAEQDGVVHYEDIIAGSTLEETLSADRKSKERRIIDLHLDVKQPRIEITDDAGETIASYYLPAGALIRVEDNQIVKAGVTLATMAKEASKTNDITGGLPRVSELFEARRPKEPAVLAKITGVVRFKGINKAKRVIVVEDEYGKAFEHEIPMNKRLLVRDGDKVKAGEKLSDGSIDAHDILDIKGENALQEFLMDEIQSVYRAQGVSINDKHIGIIVRQMLRKVEVVSVGNTKFIFGQSVDKFQFRQENERVMAEGGDPAIARPMFQGITKAALNTDSFISAASFQETTRVLTNAAIAGATDHLRGLKENVVIGHMIPAGTGIRNYRNIKLSDAYSDDLDAKMLEVLERRREERAQMQAEEFGDYDKEED